MDIALPHMDGLAATRALMANNETRGITVIALTAQAMVGDREAALAAGCVAYLTKPFDSQVLLETLQRMTYSKKAA